MPRNLSESQLVQIGSKALSNVAGQFSKLGQTLNPTKIRSAKAGSRAPTTAMTHSPSTASLELAAVADEESMAKFTIGSGHLRKPHYDDDDDDSDDSIDLHPSDQSSVVQENAFLPSVGIVMASNEVAVNAQMVSGTDQTATTEYAAKRCSADVCTMSISSVTDHINMPAGMLECGSPIRSRSPAPEIRVDDMAVPEASGSGLGKCGAQSFSRSSGEVGAGAGAAGGGGQ